MSRAFVKESDREEAPLVPPPPLPAGVPNYVTPAGHRRNRDELAALRDQERVLAAADTAEARARLPAIAARRALLEARQGTWVELAPPQRPTVVSFGCSVEVEDEQGGRRTYTLVGVDEVDVASGRVSFLSPIARALVSAEVGEVVTVETPRGHESLEIVRIWGG